jgi:hypothetical protein
MSARLRRYDSAKCGGRCVRCGGPFLIAYNDKEQTDELVCLSQECQLVVTVAQAAKRFSVLPKRD